MRYVLRNSCAVTCPGPVSWPTVADAKVNTLPARTPSTRLMIPCSPIHNPMMECRSPFFSRNFIIATLSDKVVAVVTSL